LPVQPSKLPVLGEFAAGLLTAIGVYDGLKGVPADQNSYQLASGAAEPVAAPDLGSDGTFGQTQGVAGSPDR
jgi:hypothetical protein